MNDNEIVEVGQDEAQIVETTGGNIETAELMTKMVEGIPAFAEKFSSIIRELAQVRSENAAKKYEESAKVYIAGIQEATKQELKRLENNARTNDNFFHEYAKYREKILEIRGSITSFLMESEDEEDRKFRMLVCEELNKQIEAIETNMDKLFEESQAKIESRREPTFFDRLFKRDKPCIK